MSEPRRLVEPFTRVNIVVSNRQHHQFFGLTRPLVKLLIFDLSDGEECDNCGTPHTIMHNVSIVRCLPADLVILAHQVTKAYSEAFDLVHRREAAGPNAIWQADHTLLDLLLTDDKGRPSKPWLTVILDDYRKFQWRIHRS